MKEEDNSGVAIQAEVLNMIDGFYSALSGVGSAREKDGSGSSLVPISFRRDYFTARTTAEEKVHKSTCTCGASCKCGQEGKDCGCNITKETASSPYVLAQIDVDTAFKAGVGFSRLHQASLQIVVIVTRNIAKLLTPRSGGNSMIG